MIWEGDDGATRQLTYRELWEQTNQLAGALAALGVGKGDRVGIFMPMLPETAIATFAVSKLGAIYIPIFSGYGAESVATRLRDAGAKTLITVDGFYRRGKIVPLKETADAAVAGVDSLESVIVFRRTGADGSLDSGPRSLVARDRPGSATERETERTDAEDPFMIIYTSGTTGRPKGALHTHDGFPIKATQDIAHCFDVQADDTLLWFTDLGWMMGPWAIIGTLTLGATLVLYRGDARLAGAGSPLGAGREVPHHGLRYRADRRPRADGERRRVAAQARSLLAPRPRFAAARRGIPGRGAGSSTRSAVAAARSSTTPAARRFPAASSAVSPFCPSKPTCFSAPVPGMAVDVVDDAGNPVRGAVGELVIRNAWPGMTRGFWQDTERYEETYWSRLPGLWVHGDFARIDADGFWYILGRSDDTIKVAGKRVGPAEVESAAVSHPAVQEAAAIGVPHAIKGETIVAFVVLRPGHEPGEPLRAAIEAKITDQLGKSLKPEAVKFVDDLPKTRNAKVMRRVIRARYLNLPLGDITALENPGAVDGIGNAQ